jgi:hypothetical protein
MGMFDLEDSSIKQLSGPLGERTLHNLKDNHSVGHGRRTGLIDNHSAGLAWNGP